jgi:Ca-activated chloride channel family protein
VRDILRRRRAGHFPLTGGPRALALAVLGAVAAVVCAWPVARAQAPGLSVQITSPLGRTGLQGATRIVARVNAPSGTVLSSIQFFVDGTLVGEDKDGAPYAVDWVDDNPFVPREIAVSVADDKGAVARDSVFLKPLDVSDTANVSSVVLEPSVVDEKGRPVNDLTAADFIVTEDGVPQVIDMALPDAMPATYTLLIDASQSMSRTIGFVRDAARQLPDRLRERDQVIIAPFRKGLETVTGPTTDRDTIVGAIAAIEPSGGTAILNSLVTAAERLRGIDSRHILVLITDGYDENSDVVFERALDAIRTTKVTVYVIAIGGTAGISLQGERLLKRLAAETGGRAFFPAREFQLPDVHGLIAADVQQRYVLSYTPKNQALDGTWRAIAVKTTTPTHKVRARSGYFAPEPPPIRQQIELTIRDVKGEAVDITLDDLVLLEDGVEQQIEAFQEAVAPVSVMLVLDASGSMKPDAPAVVEAARTFVNALPAKDNLGVMMFADKATIVEDLSTDRDASIQAVDKYVAAGGTALFDALYDSLSRLRHVEGRRVIVVLTDGRDENNPGTAPGSVRKLPDVLEALKQTSAIVFGIALGPKVDKDTIERVTTSSGGEAYYPQDVTGLAGEYRRVLQNLRRRFIISFTSTNSVRDGKYRTIEIKSKREGIIIGAQKGYLAPGK